MSYDVPFRVEIYKGPSVGRQFSAENEYAIMRTGDGMLARCSDLVFAYHLVDLLNAEAQAAKKPVT